MNATEWMAKLADLGCLICRRLGRGYTPAQMHHIAEGSGLRHDFAVVPLCPEHHDVARRGSGFHGMGTKTFCRIFRVPGETEWGMMAWLVEDLAKHG